MHLGSSLTESTELISEDFPEGGVHLFLHPSLSFFMFSSHHGSPVLMFSSLFGAAIMALHSSSLVANLVPWSSYFLPNPSHS